MRFYEENYESLTVTKNYNSQETIPFNLTGDRIKRRYLIKM